MDAEYKKLERRVDMLYKLISIHADVLDEILEKFDNPPIDYDKEIEKYDKEIENYNE